jgi:hypothetical protein
MSTHHRLMPTAAIALALAAGATPAAARYDYRGAAQSPNVRAATPALDATPATAGYRYRGAAESPNVRAGTQPLGPAINHSTPPATVVRVSPTNGGFDWADAGIGAAGGLALSMLGLGTVLAVSQRRTPKRRARPGLTS